MLTPKSFDKKVSIQILIGLLFIRIVVVNGLKFANLINSYELIEIIELVEYVGIALLIVFESSFLKENNISVIPIYALIFLNSILRIPVDDSFGEWAINIFFWVTSIALFYCLLKERMWNLAKESNAIGHIFIGLVFGVILSFFLKVIPGYVAGLGITISESSLINFFTSIIIDLQHSAIFEELLFRGFLVGYLTKNGISEKKILFIQSFLFWIAHVSIISQGFGFFIALPLGSIVLGYLAQKHKSILPSLLAHILYNSFDYFIS